MIHAFLDCAAGWPPAFRLVGAPGGDRTFATLARLIGALQTVRAGREHIRVWTHMPDALWFAARSEGIAPDLQIVPGLGVTALRVSNRVEIRAARQMLSDATLDALAGCDADAGLEAIHASVGELEGTLGVDAGGGIGAATTAALFRGGWMPRRTAWPSDAPDDWARWGRDAYHGGLSRVFWHGAVESAGAVGSDLYETEAPDRLPDGWTLADWDRDSSYAADGMCLLPDVSGPTVEAPESLLSADGGAIVDAEVDLAGFDGPAFPVRVDIALGITRSIPVRTGRWRGVWCSTILRWAQMRGARVTPVRGVGWTRGAHYLAPLQRVLWNRKQATTGEARETAKAAIQRAVGRLGRRPYDTVTLVGDEAQAEIADRAGWATRWSKVHGWTDQYFVADRLTDPMAPVPVPYGAVPVWPAFVVAETWIATCDALERATAAGAWPLYVDTDGICIASDAATRAALHAQAPKPGAWRVKRLYQGGEHRAARQFVRVGDDGAEVLQYAGVPRLAQRDALRGLEPSYQGRTALMDLQGAFRATTDRLSPALDHVRAGVDRARVFGRRMAATETF